MSTKIGGDYRSFGGGGKINTPFNLPSIYVYAPNTILVNNFFNVWLNYVRFTITLLLLNLIYRIDRMLVSGD